MASADWAGAPERSRRVKTSTTSSSKSSLSYLGSAGLGFLDDVGPRLIGKPNDVETGLAPRENDARVSGLRSRDPRRLPLAFAGPASGGGDDRGVIRLSACDVLEELGLESLHFRFLPPAFVL